MSEQGLQRPLAAERPSAWVEVGEAVALRQPPEREREERIVLIATLPRQRRRLHTRLLRPQRDPEGGTR